VQRARGAGRAYYSNIIKELMSMEFDTPVYRIYTAMHEIRISISSSSSDISRNELMYWYVDLARIAEPIPDSSEMIRIKSHIKELSDESTTEDYIYWYSELSRISYDKCEDELIEEAINILKFHSGQICIIRSIVDSEHSSMIQEEVDYWNEEYARVSESMRVASLRLSSIQNIRSVIKDLPSNSPNSDILYWNEELFRFITRPYD